MRAESLIDAGAFIERVASDPVLAHQVIDLFVAEAPKLLAEIQQAICDHDNTCLAGATHSIKGSIGNFSSERAYEPPESWRRWVTTTISQTLPKPFPC